MKIMYVDDEKDQIITLKQLLAQHKPVEFIGANSGNECLDLLHDGNIPDILFVDIMMKDMSGWELYDKLKAEAKLRNIPVFFLTARTDEVAEQAGSFLADGYVEKPIEIERILECIEQVENKKTAAES